MNINPLRWLVNIQDVMKISVKLWENIVSEDNRVISGSPKETGSDMAVICNYTDCVIGIIGVTKSWQLLVNVAIIMIG